MALAPVTATPPGASPQDPSTQSKATDAFNLSFESLLKIILTQLTYQDPLKPMDNFEFVSQLAQFSQIQIGQTGNDRLAEVAAAQSTLQATALLGKVVEIPAGSTTLSGTVTSISFAEGVPKIAIKTSAGDTISNISMASVSQVRGGN